MSTAEWKPGMCPCCGHELPKDDIIFIKTAEIARRHVYHKATCRFCNGTISKNSEAIKIISRTQEGRPYPAIWLCFSCSEELRGVLELMRGKKNVSL